MTSLNVLLVRAGALGDIVLLRRAVFALRSGGARVSLLAPSDVGWVLAGAGAAQVEAVLPWERADMAALLADSDALPASLVSVAGFDTAIAYTRSAALLAGLRRLLPRVIACDPSPPPGVHASRWLAEPTRELGFETAAEPPPLVPSPEVAAIARSFVGSLGPGPLGVHPGSGSPAKNWPAERFAELASRLSPDRPWLLVEGPADAQAAAPLRAMAGAHRLRLLPPPVLTAVLAHAGLYVGNDSGVSHLAAAAGTPTLALFGPTDPLTWGPVGPRVETLRSPDGTTMSGLGLEEVAAAAFRLRSAAREPPSR